MWTRQCGTQGAKLSYVHNSGVLGKQMELLLETKRWKSLMFLLLREI